MKYLSLFSGIGGFELGIKQAYEQISSIENEKQGLQGVGDSQGRCSQLNNICSDGLTCIGYSEIDKYATQIYQKHFPEHKNYGDIKLIEEGKLPDFDLIVGGFPCQSFSIAGKRGGFEDTRGTLFFDIARILKCKQPRLLLLENVKGLLSHDEGRTFRTIITTLDELGYDLQWQVLNSKNFGVPQNRERVFIVGHLRGTRRPEVFPFIGSDSDIDEGDKKREVKISDTITTRYSSRNGRGTHTFIRQFGLLKESEKPSGNYLPRERVLDSSGGARAVSTSQSQHPFYTDGAKIRRLTPTECERLQGFPDGWTDGVSDTQRYKCLGNAVTVNVIANIMKKIIT